MAKKITAADYNSTKSKHAEYDEILCSVEQTINSLGKQLQARLANLKSVYRGNNTINTGVQQAINASMRELVILDRLTPLYTDAKKLQEKYKFVIQNDIITAAVIVNGFRWMFTSSSNKAKAEEAYSRLVSLLNGEYSQGVIRIQSEMANAFSVTPEEAIKLVDSDRKKFAIIINKVFPYAFAGQEPYLSRRFDDTEIQNVLSKYNTMYQNINSVYSHCAGAEKDIVVFVNSLVIGDALDKYVESELRTGKDNTNISGQVYVLLDKIYYYLHTRDLHKESESLLSTYRGRIQESINSLRNGVSGLGWIFASYEAKVSAEESFDYLKKILDSDYAHSISNVFYEHNNRKYPQPDTVIKDYYTHRSEYEKVLKQSAQFAFSSEKLLGFLQSLFSGVRGQQYKFSNGDQIIDGCKNDIKESIQRYQYDDLIEVLSGVPVEELNRDKSGIKVKLLKEQGFNTIADIYKTTTNRLAWIKGISWENACLIKWITSNIVTKTSKTIGIKLSVDTRTPAATDLVQKIHTYLLKTESLKKARGLLKERNDAVQQAESKLKTIGNGINWLFIDKSQKDEYKTHYDILIDYVSGECGIHLSQLQSSLYGKSNLSDDEVWDDFSENTIAYYNALEEICPGILGDDAGDYGLPEDLARQIAEEDIFPDGLLCTSRNVLVYRLLCENSVDEKISDVLQYKQSLFDAFADESVSGKESIELDQVGFKEIIQEEIDRINAKYGRTET